MSQRPSALKGPASAGPFRVVAAVLLAVTVAVAGGACKTGKGKTDEDAKGELPKRLGAQPAVIDPASTTTSVTGGATSTSVGGGGPGGPGPGGTTPTTGPPGGTTNTTAPVPPFRAVATVTDAGNDAGLEAPPYDDIRSLRVEDNGPSARFTVEFAGALPPKLADGEVMGVGVDVYAPGARGESDFQLFADGSKDGWLAYLQAGDEFVRYPGTFELGGSRLVFTVPWSAIGGRKAGEMAMFADWTQDRTLLAAAGQDKAPNNSHAPFAP